MCVKHGANALSKHRIVNNVLFPLTWALLAILGCPKHEFIFKFSFSVGDFIDVAMQIFDEEERREGIRS